ncbi:hypothetical protein [Pseudomonas atacamensis]|uniref:hypothetical protein n=1 Tax=Pseudomonas atacamensis TaxID=2565368 RepID=UPI003829836A
MAKATATPGADASTSTSTDLRLTFRDKVFTSRTLCIPGTNRTLAVVKASVDVSASDEQAVTFLKSHPELEAQE